MEEREWWKRPLRVIQTNLQVKDTGKMDAGKIAREIEELCGNVLVTNVGGIYAWYQSEVKYHHVNEYLPKDRDLLKELIEECHKRGMKVFATILHYAAPVHLVTAYGGWKNRRMIDFYLRYCKTLYERLGNLVDFWLPFNEINCSRFNPWNGCCLIKDQEPHYDQAIFQCTHHQLLANALAVRMAHEMLPGSKVGGMIARFTSYPATCSPDDVMCGILDENYTNYFYTDVMARGRYPSYTKRMFASLGVQIETQPGDEEILAAGKVDFLSFSYYMSMISTNASGVRRAQRLQSIPANTAALRTMVTAPKRTKEAKIPSFSPLSSFSPKRIEKTVPLPMASPSRMDVRKVIREKADPTAARASAPRNRPTISVSAIL